MNAHIIALLLIVALIAVAWAGYRLLQRIAAFLENIG